MATMSFFSSRCALALGLIGVACATSPRTSTSAATSTVVPSAAAVTEADVRSMLFSLADDSMEGRGTATVG
ncbi:MAG TPA: hypothetical protein VIV65_01010, partial [Gemmatimonadaceae bacterium]